MPKERVPFFSVIIPVHNRENFIGSVIQSVLDQQFENFELIIVDDGSTDGTELKARSFLDSRIRYVKIQNGERGAARNAGADRAEGLYFNFFDSDDLMYNHHLKTAYSFIEMNNFPPWFHVGYEIKDETGKTVSQETGVRKNPDKKLIRTNYLGCNSVFIERSLFQQTRFNTDRRLSSSEDWELWLRVISKQDLIVCRAITFQMIHHAKRSLLTISPDRVIERDTFMLQALLQDKIFSKKFKKELLIFEADRYTFFALSLIMAKRQKEAFFYLVKSLNTTSCVLTKKRFWACIKLLILGQMNSSRG